MGDKRTSKFWFKNEKDVLKKLGLEPVPLSGAGVRKEDGENENILCQLKSTSANSITIKEDDVNKLFYHAEQLRKIPVFAVQFLGGALLLAVPPNELKNIASYLNGDGFKKDGIDHLDVNSVKRDRKFIPSSKNVKAFYKEKPEPNKNKTAFEVRQERAKIKERMENRRNGIE